MIHSLLFQKAQLTVRLEDVHYRVGKKGNEITAAPPFRLDVIDFLNSVHPEVSDIVLGANTLFEARNAHTGSGEISHFERYADSTWQSIWRYLMILAHTELRNNPPGVIRVSEHPLTTSIRMKVKSRRSSLSPTGGLSDSNPSHHFYDPSQYAMQLC